MDFTVVDRTCPTCGLVGSVSKKLIDGRIVMIHMGKCMLEFYIANPAEADKEQLSADFLQELKRGIR